MILYRIRDVAGEVYYFTEHSSTFLNYVGKCEPGRVRNLDDGGTLAAKEVPSGFVVYAEDGATLVEDTWKRYRCGGAREVA